MKQEVNAGTQLPVAARGWLRRLRCRLGLHGESFRTAENDTHLWGECIHCGKKAGIISRAAVRRYMEAQDRDELARAAIARATGDA